MVKKKERSGENRKESERKEDGQREVLSGQRGEGPTRGEG